MKYGNATLGQVEAVWNKLGGEEGVNQFLSGALTLVKVPLLEKIGIVNLPATGSKFVALENFTVDSQNVKMDSTWRKQFEKILFEKTEDCQAEIVLRYSELRRSSCNELIVDELGNLAETTLSNIWQLLEKQPNGESGVLQTNRYGNSFFVRDAEEGLHNLSLIWGPVGWEIIIHDIHSWDKKGFIEGRRIFSKD